MYTQFSPTSTTRYSECASVQFNKRGIKTRNVPQLDAIYGTTAGIKKDNANSHSDRKKNCYYILCYGGMVYHTLSTAIKTRLHNSCSCCSAQQRIVKTERHEDVMKYFGILFRWQSMGLNWIHGSDFEQVCRGDASQGTYNL